MKLALALALALLLVPALADPRDSGAGTPFNKPDGLKTSDPFYIAMGAQSTLPGVLDQVGYQLPAIFGGPMPTKTIEPAWMNLSAHNEKLNSSLKKIVAANSYELSETQMKGVPLGKEQWL